MPVKNFSQNIKDLDGVDIKDSLDQTKFVPMKTVAVNALMGSFPTETPQPDGQAKLDRYLLATKINAGGDVELTPNDIVLLKKLIALGYPALIYGQMSVYLDA